MKTVKISNAETMKKAALLMKDPKKQRSALNLAATWAASSSTPSLRATTS